MNEQIDSFNSSRNCVFIDLNTAVITKMKALADSTTYENKDCKKHPRLKLAFPPLIEPKDLIVKPVNGGKPPRAPNAFIIYRKIFVETAKDSGYHLPMTVISSMASKSWEDESETVKSHYKQLASEAYKYRNELYPRLERRKRRSRWNIVSFQPQTEQQEMQELQEAQEQIQQQPSNDYIKTPELDTSSSDSSPVVDDFPILLSSPIEEDKRIVTDSEISVHFNPPDGFFQTELYNTISNNSFLVNNDSIPTMNDQFCFDHNNTIYSPVYSSPVEQFSVSNYSSSPQVQHNLNSGFSSVNIDNVNNDYITYNPILLQVTKNIVPENNNNNNNNNNILSANDVIDNNSNISNVSDISNIVGIINNDALGIIQIPFNISQY